MKIIRIRIIKYTIENKEDFKNVIRYLMITKRSTYHYICQFLHCIISIKIYVVSYVVTILTVLYDILFNYLQYIIMETCF